VAVLIRAAAIAVALAGCYDPALRDCTVTCHAAGDCASGQVCGADGFCAAPEIAGTCRAADAHALADAPPLADAGPADAAPAQLHVTIGGHGMVVDSTGTRTCTTDCLFPAIPDETITLTAVASGAGHPFQDWSTANCMGMGASCTVTIVAPVTTVTAVFK
jgi:hypothetical protein